MQSHKIPQIKILIIIEQNYAKHIRETTLLIYEPSVILKSGDFLSEES